MTKIWVLVLVWGYGYQDLEGIYHHGIAFRTQGACEAMRDNEQAKYYSNYPYVRRTIARCDEIEVPPQ